MKMMLLIISILMTRICLADEPEIIDYGLTINDTFTVNSKPSLGFYRDSMPIVNIETSLDNKFFDVDKDSIKISCPDGYKLVFKIFNRNGHWKPATDADLKCVKEE